MHYPLLVCRLELGGLQQHERVRPSHENRLWRSNVRLDVVFNGDVKHVLRVQLLLFRFELA